MIHDVINKNNDYYLSYGSAMEIHNMVTQPQLIVYISSLKMKRPIRISGYEFRFVCVKKEYSKNKVRFPVGEYKIMAIYQNANKGIN